MATITEDYVSFEVAKLLKEKGFDQNCATYYLDGHVWRHYYGEVIPKGNQIYAAPTQAMAMKRLREVQGLNIYVRAVWKDVEVQYGNRKPAVVGYDWFVESLLDDTYSKISIEPSLTYEEASEAAIKYCLENLI